MSSTDVKQWELANAPTDGITSLRFSRLHDTSDSLLCSSWDGTVRMYRAKASTCSWMYTETFAGEGDGTIPASVLSSCFGSSEQTVYAGGLNKAVTALSISPTGEVISTTLGLHDKEVKEVAWNAATGTVVSAGWDNKFCSWDPRAKSKSHLVSTCDLPAKAFTMDVSGRNVIVGCAQRKVVFFDVRKLEKPVSVMSSSLKHQTRVLRCMPDSSGYALGTVEGRIAIEYIDVEEHESRAYSFKCHRDKKTEGQEIVFPVNAIAYHPVHGTFATGGCDGHVYTWDGNAKKRLAHYPRYPTSIATLDFSADGTMLAVSSSYTFEKGELDETPKDQLFIRSVEESDVRPRKSKSKGKKRKAAASGGGGGK